MPSPTPLAKRLTEAYANDQLLYFTSTSLSADDSTLVFISDRDSPIPKERDPRANVNLYALDRKSGEVRRLTDNEDGYLRAYVYFDGQPYHGLGLASPSFHAPSGDLYYLQGRELRCVNAHTGKMRTLALLPADHVTGFTHVSDDNSRVCVPTIHEVAFRDTRAIDATVQRLGLESHLRIFDTVSGEQVEDVEVDKGWVTHVQFRPGSNTTILFNHEWPGDCGIRRMWLWDGKRIRRLRPQGKNADGTYRHRGDWVCHEIWSRDGRYIVYHGSYAPQEGDKTGRSFIGRVSPAANDHSELAFAAGFERYGHFSLGNTVNTLVSDGYYASIDDPREGHSGRWLSLLQVAWEEHRLEWTSLIQHGSSWTSQDAHPHPIFSHSGKEVLFTSDRSGKRAIYALDVHPFV